MTEIIQIDGICSRVEKDNGVFRSTIRFNEKSYPHLISWDTLTVDAEIRPGTEVVCVIYEKE